jgi:FkbM family methyltransferase|tara:strand:+ start:120 stop:743 length:624 start_codon:yes stop_codon:yes gene_type:complete
MLIDFTNFLTEHKMKVTGILHVGAHRAQEQGAYKEEVQPHNIFWIEALGHVVEELKQQDPQLNIFQAVIDEEEKEVEFNVANNEESSSLLNFGTHRQSHPNVEHVETIKTRTTRVDTVIKEKQLPIENINFLNTDIQGNDLACIKSLGEYIKHIDYIYTGIYTGNVYDGNPLVGEVDEFLESKGFSRVETEITPWEWGDALYIRSKQ